MLAEVAREPWDGFVAGPENALAHAGVLALARGEVQGISPLVIHGPAGVGKSALLDALVGERLRRRPESAVAYLTGESFAAACASANARSEGEGWAELRARFRNVDLLVLDDLHALARVPLAFDELVPTLDALDEAGAGVAVAARSGPGGWDDWPAKLVSRLSAGLSVRVDPPGLESRRRYLMDRARACKLSLAAEAVDSLSEQADGYRTLDGWLAKLALASRLERRPLDRALAGPLLAEDAPAPAVDIDRIARDVAARFGVRPHELRAVTRRRTVVEPRHLAIGLARELTGLSFAAIGAYFGGRDAATVRHACKMAADRMAADPSLSAAASSLRQQWSRTDEAP
jgi:chromosomal replication initiator protein